MNIAIIIITTILTIVSIPSVFVFLLTMAWSTTHYVLSYLVLIGVLLVYGYIWRIVLSYVCKKHLKKKTHLLFLMCFVIIVLGIGGFYAYDAYNNRFARVDNEVDLEEYKPFESDKLATLKEASTLKLTGDLPVLDGATALYPVYSAMSEAIYPKNSYSPYNSVVLCSTTPTAYDNLLQGNADIIFVAGPSKQQASSFINAQKEMKMTPIGKEAFVFFVNAKNPVDTLTMEQIKDIYSGNITNWKEVGGNDESIKAFQRPEGSGSQSALLRLMGNQKVMQPLVEDVAEGMGGIISQTAMYQNRENAIGYSFRFFADEMVANKEIKLLKIDGVAPSKKNIQNERYPIVNPFYAITLATNTKPHVESLLQWLESPQGKELIDKSGYVAY